MGGIADILTGVVNSIVGAVTLDGDRFVGGLKQVGLGSLNVVGLRQAFTEEWVRIPGMTGGIPLPRSLAEALVRANSRGKTHKADAQNGMHGWHASTNASISSQVGILAIPIMFLAGIAHELDPGSVSAEFGAQGGVNAFLDALGDIGANSVGMIGGLFSTPNAAPSVGRTLGNYIPGPGDPDPRGIGRGGYQGDPTKAWSN